MKRTTWAAVAVAVGAAMADTVTIAPGSGVFTNVTARIAGETDVEINSGTSGGGIVRLNAANGYVGTTTVNCGTLVVDSVAETGNNSSLGSGGDVVMGRGTFLYNGPDGGVIDRAFTNNVTGRAAIYNISNELWITGDMRQNTASFVKTGPGTLHLAGSGTNIFYSKSGPLSDNTSGLQARYVPTANGDAPSKGYRHFHVLEGTLVLGEGGGTFLVDNGNNVGAGGWLAADGEQEKEAHLEIRGGKVQFTSWFMHACYNGKTSTTPQKRTASSVRIYAGDFTMGSGTFAMGRNKLGYGTYAQNGEPHLEIYGGTFTASNLSLSDDRGANSVVLVHGGKATVENAYAGRCSGNADTTVLMEIKAPGRFIANSVHNSNGSVFNVHVVDGGVLQVDTIQNKSTGELNVLIDGGTVIGRQNGTFASFYANLTSVKIGGKGAVVGGYGVARTRHLIEDAGDGAAEPAGLVISNLTATSIYEFGEPATYRGPTLLKQGLLSFCASGALPETTTLTVAAGGVQATNAQAVVGRAVFGVADTSPALAVRSAAGFPFMVTNAFALAGTPSLQVTMYEPDGNTAALKTDGTYPVLSVPLADKAALEELATRASLVSPSTATSAVFSVVESGDAAELRLAVAFPAPDPVVTHEQTAGTWTNGTLDGLWATGGNWEDGAALDAAGATATFPDLEEGVARTVAIGADANVTVGGLAFTGTGDYTISGGTLTFDNGTAGAVISSLGGASHTVSSTLAGTWPVKVNPAATGGGHVTLANVGSGFTGALTTGSGTTELGSLAFVRDADDLVIGPGTLKYTGTGETVPGLTINAGSAKAAILDVEHDLTLLSLARGGTSSFMKTGGGDLVLKGNGTFELGNSNKSASGKKGIGLYGDSPVDTLQSVTLANGRLVIGTVGDDADAPTVSQSGETDIGGCTASETNGRRETAGELVMNNGTYTLGIIELGYYAGNTNVTGDAREDALVPRIEMNGGTVSCTGISTAWDGAYLQNIRPEIAIRGGTVNVNGDLRLNSYPSVTTNLLTTWTQDGGAVTSTSMTVASKAGSNATRHVGELVMDLKGGLLAVNGTTTFYNNAPVTINVYTGAVYQTGSITASSCTSNTAAIYFRGGRYSGWTSATGNTTLNNNTGWRMFLADDLVFDTSANEGPGTPRNYWTYINRPILADPESERTDFGITVVGGGRVAFGTVFANSTITGAITASEGSTLIPLTTAFSNATVVVEPGGTLQQYNVLYAKRTGAPIKNLTLGKAGEDGIVYLDLFNGTVNSARTNYAFAVTGDLAVNGPVAVTTHTDNSRAMPGVVAGTYTALVYRAEISLDVSKFTTGRYDGALAATYKEVTLPDNEPNYPGWHALVCTVTSESAGYDGAGEGAREWNAVTSGGDWSAAANWNGFDPPEGTDADAVFRPAKAANVPVALDAPVTVRGLTLAASSAKNGYRLSGSPLTVSTGSKSTAAIYANSGTNTFACDVGIRQRTLVQTATGAKTTFAGTVDGGDSLLGVNYAEATGGGTVEFGMITNIANLVIRSGRMVLPTVAGITGPSALRLAGGTLKYTGTGETLPGIYLYGLTANKCSVLDVDRDLTLLSMTTNATATAFSKIGAGDLILKGNGTFKGGNGAINRGSQNETYVRANGDGPVATFRRFNVSEGRVIQGTAGDPNDAPNFICSDFCVGVDTVNGKNCEYVMNNGTMTLGSCYINYYHGSATAVCTGKFTVNGGTVNANWLRICQSGDASMKSTGIFEMNGGEVTTTGAFVLGYQRMRNANIGSYLYMNGGKLKVGTSLYLVYLTMTSSGTSYKATDGYVHINGGTVDVADTLSLCNDVNSTGRLFLNGGSISANAISHNNGKAYITFNGGTLGLKEDGTLPAITGAYVSTNGATIAVSAGKTYEIGQALTTDALLNGAPDGGLTKTGPGTLVLSGANTFTGPTTIAGGVLRATADEALSGRVVLTANGVLDCAGGTRTVGEINMRGLVQNGTLRVAGALVADLARDLFLNVEGNLVVDAGAKLDLGLTAEDLLPVGTQIPLASVTGTLAAPGRVKVLNGGNVGAAKLKVVDGMLYAVAADSGTMVIVR